MSMIIVYTVDGMKVFIHDFRKVTDFNMRLECTTYEPL